MKKFALALAIASMMSLPVVGATNYWNGDANYPEITNTELTYLIMQDKATTLTKDPSLRASTAAVTLSLA